MIATIENHCQRERRNLSMRPVSRKNSANLILSPGWARPRARIHPTAKKPASNNSSKAVLSMKATPELKELAWCSSACTLGRLFGQKKRAKGRTRMAEIRVTGVQALSEHQIFTRNSARRGTEEGSPPFVVERREQLLKNVRRLCWQEPAKSNSNFLLSALENCQREGQVGPTPPFGHRDWRSQSSPPGFGG